MCVYGCVGGVGVFVLQMYQKAYTSEHRHTQRDRFGHTQRTHIQHTQHTHTTHIHTSPFTHFLHRFDIAFLFCLFERLSCLDK